MTVQGDRNVWGWQGSLLAFGLTALAELMASIAQSQIEVDR